MSGFNQLNPAGKPDTAAAYQDQLAKLCQFNAGAISLDGVSPQSMSAFLEEFQLKHKQQFKFCYLECQAHWLASDLMTQVAQGFSLPWQSKSQVTKPIDDQKIWVLILNGAQTLNFSALTAIAELALQGNKVKLPIVLAGQFNQSNIHLQQFFPNIKKILLYDLKPNLGEKPSIDFNDHKFEQVIFQAASQASMLSSRSPVMEQLIELNEEAKPEGKPALKVRIQTALKKIPMHVYLGLAAGVCLLLIICLSYALLQMNAEPEVLEKKPAATATEIAVPEEAKSVPINEIPVPKVEAPKLVETKPIASNIEKNNDSAPASTHTQDMPAKPKHESKQQLMQTSRGDFFVDLPELSESNSAPTLNLAKRVKPKPYVPLPEIEAIRPKNIAQVAKIEPNQAVVDTLIAEPIIEKSPKSNIQAPVTKQPIKSQIEKLSRNEMDLLKIQASHLSIQLMASSEKQSALDFVNRNKLQDKAKIYRRTMHGKPWFVVVYGNYISHNDASAAIKQLPKSLRVNKPWITQYDTIQQQIKQH